MTPTKSRPNRRIEAKPLSLRLYSAGIAAAGGLADGWLHRRSEKGKEDPSRLKERLGKTDRARPPGRLVWLHAASVGETMSVLPVLGRLANRLADCHVLVTTATRSAAELLHKRAAAGDLPPGLGADRLIHQYLPVDRRDATESFLNHWRPDLVLWTESELWPTLLSSVFERGLPAAMLNARLSPRSARRWRILPAAARYMLGGFDLILAQSEADRDRLQALGAEHAQYLGNLKFAAPPLGVDEGELERLASALSGRDAWSCASTHPGEEDIAIQIHRQLLSDHEDILTVIVPRHPERAGEIEMMANRSHLAVARRSRGEVPQPWHDIFLVDTIGELGLVYRLAPVVCVGGSLVDHGGHNPIEPAQLGCAVILGRFMDNFQEITQEMRHARAVRQVPDPDMLLFAVDELLRDASARAELGSRAQEVAEANRAVLDRVADALEPILCQLEAGTGAER